MALLWSDRGEQQARSSLRQLLTELRKALAVFDPSLLTTQRDCLSLDPDGMEVDAGLFEGLIDVGTAEAMAQAADLYEGDLLDGLEVRDGAFDDWLEVERERFRGRACRALQCLLGQQNGDEATATAWRLLALDPLREAAHRALMQAHDGKGERTLALRQYRICRDRLAAELGVAPEPETERLAAAIRAGTTGGPAAAGPAVEGGAAPPLPDKPSIAVLPFTNMSGDPEQEYFADGIADEIITALSNVPNLFIVARNSTFTYKGKAVDVKQVGREQGVHYVLEGSVRKYADRIRVTAQLIDAATGNHQWAERYDGKLDDVFEVQDEITKKVTTELNVQLARGEEARVWARGTTNLDAWEIVIRACPLTDDHVKEHNAEAQRLAGEAVHLDPGYAAAWVMLGWTHWEDALWGWGESHDISIETALGCARNALECDADNPDALALLGSIHLSNKDTEKAIEFGQKAVALSPNHAGNLALAAMAMIFGGQPENGLPLIKRAMRLSPIYPQWYFMMVGAVHHILGDQEQAIEVFRECLEKEPETTLHRLWLASALVAAGKDDEARLLAHEILEIDPDFSTSHWVDSFVADDALAELLSRNLRKANLPK